MRGALEGRRHLRLKGSSGMREKRMRSLHLWTRSREGVPRMLIEALRAGADDYVEPHRGGREERRHALAVCNGRAQACKVTFGAGTEELSAAGR
jgi:hypothetical protein